VFKPKNALEILTVRAFLSYLDKGYGILPLGNSIFAVAYEIYVRDHYGHQRSVCITRFYQLV